MFDFQWLGVGRVRCGVVHEGKIYYVHQFIHDNITTSTYTTNMNLPIRYEIISTGGHGQLQQICGTAISEGGYNPVGLTFSASNNTTYKTVGTTEIPLVSIRLKSDRNRTNVIPGDFNILTETNSNIIYFIRLYRAPSSSPLTGANWNSANVNSAIEYDVSATALNTAGSILVSQGYSSGKTSKQLSGDLTLAFSGYNQLTANINGVSDYFVISAKRFSGGSDINTVASLEWREIF